ncbi:MAG: tRNA (adenosine(37)-N6)-threonylcarbamoyltransferase complex dimerization subunit type 1 TsaB [Candidatus Melainabacteria bacterium]|jgi:tRNA threonylcarbamoyl adenosine modification protein YeaZ|nr:tRNA (adenosine(37)-N6)-threonylcarbamoyltransferase complex dimerization subunit type 1 TsaB [Candidatus Melainabacteria bacterium]
MLVLALDSSCKQQSITLFDTEIDKTLSSFQAEQKSSQLMPALVQAFEGAGIKPQELELIACSVGPGSFTGIRTALTIVKTMAAQLNLPIITLNNFDLLRHKFKLGPKDPVLMHAGKNDYFLSLDDDYDNPETNFFSFETLGYDLLDLTEVKSLSEKLPDARLATQVVSELTEPEMFRDAEQVNSSKLDGSPVSTSSFECNAADGTFRTGSNTADLIIDYMQAHPELQSMKYTELQPYYLREPSVNQKKSPGLPA